MGIPGLLISGNGTNQTLYGSNGDDAFSGSTGQETFATGLGDDVVYAALGADRVFADIGNDWLHGGGGTDTLDFSVVNKVSTIGSEANTSGIRFDLNKAVNNLGFLGIKTTYGFEDVDATYANDKVWGTSGSNQFELLAGNDFADGRAGNDSITGDHGRDTLVGGKGADVLAGEYIGSLGNDGAVDHYRYLAITDSKVAASARDHIYGWFNGGAAEGDRIDLSRIDANGSASGNGVFKFVGGAAFSSNSTGLVGVVATGNPSEYLVSVDVDTDAAPEMTFYVHSSVPLVKGDFIL